MSELRVSMIMLDSVPLVTGQPSYAPLVYPMTVGAVFPLPRLIFTMVPLLDPNSAYARGKIDAPRIQLAIAPTRRHTRRQRGGSSAINVIPPPVYALFTAPEPE